MKHKLKMIEKDDENFKNAEICWFCEQIFFLLKTDTFLPVC